MPTELFIAAPCRGQASNGYRAQQSAGLPPSVLGNGFFFRRNQKEPVRVLKVVGKLGWFARIPSSCPEFSKTVSRPASQHFRLFNRITNFRIERRKINNLAGYEGARDLITCRLPRRGRDWLRPRRLFLSRRLGALVLESCRA
jgi:hypothetical protein